MWCFFYMKIGIIGNGRHSKKIQKILIKKKLDFYIYKPEKPKYNYTPDPDRKYNKYWDAIDAAADTGNRMTDD